ncbi:MAG: ABC transporter substrate-binding protein [Firmicutes bacterium]|nr:ABC transporter substrate-binding protein [Bacillota bacterium]
MKKGWILFLICLLVFSLSACGGADSATEGYHIGICQLVEHEALDDASQGFQDALSDAFGDAVTFDIQNAQNDLSVCSTIINGFVTSDVDLILANSTSVLQTATTGTADIPILGTSVTAYDEALSIEDFNGIGGGNISGTSDFAAFDEQAAMIREWMPEAKTAALLYCSSEANSLFQIESMETELKTLGIDVELYPFSDSNDLSAVCSAAAESCDLIFVPTDNTVAANAGIIENICLGAKVPVFGGDRGICGSCGVAALAVSYYDLGYQTGEMAVQILKGEADIASMPIEYAEAVKVYNKEICDALGIDIVDGYEPILSD